MRITILDGSQGKDHLDFSEYIKKLTNQLDTNNSVELYQLNGMNLSFCNGCWSCWWKTPGICATKDDAELIHRSVINSDFVIFASPLIAGFISSKLKQITDRLIVLLHPYIQYEIGESHHIKRYEKYPDFGLVLKREDDTDDEDLKIVKDIYDRFGLNFHSKQKYLKVIDKNNMEDIVNETNNI